MTYFRNVEGENIYCIRQITTERIRRVNMIKFCIEKILVKIKI